MEKIEVVNPYNNETIGSIKLMNAKEIESSIDLAKSALNKLLKLTTGDKKNILNEIGNKIHDQKDIFAKTICLESGKPYQYALGEVERAIETFKIAADLCSQLPKELIDLSRTNKGNQLQGIVKYFPVGIIYGIAPFNFPLNLAVHKIAPAIASGCPILLKPSTKTPLTMELLAKIIDETQLPKGGFKLMHTSRENGNLIIKHPEINIISFTGSPDVGWEIKKHAGKKKVILELGGNAAAIVCKDANIDLALNELVIGAFAYSGQVCIHTQRIYVDEKNYDLFLEKFINRVKELKIGAPQSTDTKFSIMIDESNAIRVENWINEAKDLGAEILLNGKRKGNLLPPCILKNTKKGMKVRDEEVFGPVVCIESFSNLLEAINEVNDSKFGLQAAIFTDSLSNINQAYNKLEVGGLIHNRSTSFRVDDMPYGGVKDSGFGREGVLYAIRDYLEPKLLVMESGEL